MVKKRLEQNLQKAVKELGYNSIDPDKIGTDIVCDIPKNPAFGDYTTNIALQLANQKQEKSKQPASFIANQIVEKLKSFDYAQDYISDIKIAGPGFINFFITPESLISSLERVCDYSSLVKVNIKVGDEDKKIFVEYASFNTCKPIHIGHLRNIVLGESVSRLLESLDNKVFRATYTSDIGLPFAKTVWAILQDKEKYAKIKKSPLKERIDYLGKCYIHGVEKYDDDEETRKEIIEVNKAIYARDSKVFPLWEEVRTWNIDYFEHIYQLMGTKFDGYFWESEVEGEGKEIVEKNIGKVFIESEGAVIFPGEEYGLHNRVFINSIGLPTYEAKDMALAGLQYKAFNFDKAIHVVANDQQEYFKVIFKALSMINPDVAAKEEHLSYGYVNLASGKMASRKGNVITLEDLLDETRAKIRTIMDKGKKFEASEREQIVETVSIGAVKFAILKFAPTTDVIFDLNSSISLQGDSGPYLQYTYARSKSVLRSAQYNYIVGAEGGDLEVEERELLRMIEHFDSVVLGAAKELHPNIICSFLLEFAKLFNLFYQKHTIIKGDKSEFRLALTCASSVILKQGLYLLGIDAPERM